MSIDRAEGGRRIVGVEERAGTVVDGLAGNRHVVGVHHAVDEPDGEPPGHQLGLAADDSFEQGAVGVLGLGGRGIVAGDGMVREHTQALDIAPSGEELERADADMARRDAGEDGPGQHRLTDHPLPGRDRGEGAGGRNAERVHRLADEILAQHRPERSATVAPARKRRRARTLELDVAAAPVAINDFPEQNGTPIAELRYELPELVPGIGCRERFRPRGNTLPREDRDPLRAFKSLGIETEIDGERPIQPHQSRRLDRCRRDPGEEAVRQARVAVVEGE